MRNAYCRLDQRGDTEDVIRIIRLIEGAGREAVTAETILTKDLSTYMTLADMALVLIFDFIRLSKAASTVGAITAEFSVGKVTSSTTAAVLAMPAMCMGVWSFAPKCLWSN